MTTSSLGLIAGLLLGIAAAAGGLTGFVVALILGAAGYLVGGQRDGEFDLSALLPGRRNG
jgi:nitrate/nitrite transporter NarK